MQAFAQIYKISGSEEFCDIFIKILNGFDFVLTSLNLMNTESPTKHITLSAVSALRLTNSIFNREEYKSSDEKFHPKSKILVAATLKLQQELRKALFCGVFKEQVDVQVVLEFFTHKRYGFLNLCKAIAKWIKRMNLWYKVLKEQELQHKFMNMHGNTD